MRLQNCTEFTNMDCFKCLELDYWKYKTIFVLKIKIITEIIVFTKNPKIF